MTYSYVPKQLGPALVFASILVALSIYPRYLLWGLLGIPALVDHRFRFRVQWTDQDQYVIFSLFTALYNVCWHPLSSYPGPLLRAAFYLPEAYMTLKGTGYIGIQNLHDKYGSVVRVAPSVLSYNSAQAWKDIYGFKPDRSELAKDLSYYRRVGSMHILNATQQEHQRVRKLLAPGFSDRALIEQEPLLKTYFNLLVSKLDGQVVGAAQGKVDLMSYYNFITFDIIGDLVLGEPFGALEGEYYHDWMRNFFESIKFLGVIRFATRYTLAGLLLAFAQLIFPSLGDKRTAHLAFTKAKINARLARDTDRKDIIASIMQDNVKSEYAQLTNREILANARILLAAGTDTTATTLSGATWLLLTHPDMLQRAQAEVRATFRTPEDMSLRSVSEAERLPYLNAVIQETMRVYPSIPSILPRVTGPDGFIIDGQYVPTNISVGVHQWSAYHSKDNFALPDDFYPERWLPAERPAIFEDDDRDALQPFTIGPRACIGKTHIKKPFFILQVTKYLAYFEIRSILTRILWHFELQLEDESQYWIKQKEYAFWDKPPLWVTLKRRSDVS